MNSAVGRVAQTNLGRPFNLRERHWPLYRHVQARQSLVVVTVDGAPVFKPVSELSVSGVGPIGRLRLPAASTTD